MRLYQDIKVYSGSKLKLTFPYIVDVNIETNKNNFTDTATVRFPRKSFQNDEKLTDYIEVGDRIEIEIGYINYKDRTFFSGTIVEMSSRNIVTLKIENEAFLYKTEVIDPKIHRSIKLHDLIGFYYKGKFEAINDDIGDWVVNKNATFINLLDELRQKLGLLSYWQKGILYVGAETIKEGLTIIFNVQKNVPENTDQIITKKPTDVGVVSYGLSTQKDGTKFERYAYYKDATRKEIIVSKTKPNGTINEMKMNNISLSSLVNLIKRRLPNLYTNVNSGTIQTFGVPSIEHGDFAMVLDSKNIDIQGKYSILGVSKSFSVGGGFKQTATIGLKVRNVS